MKNYNSKLKSFIFFAPAVFLFCLFPFFALAAPSISNISGNLINNWAVTISGSGFGTKTPAKPFLWAPFSNGDLSPSALGVRTSWTSVMTGYVQYDSTGGYNGSASVRDSLTSRPSGGDGWTMGVDTQPDWMFNSLGQKSYIYRKVKKNFWIDSGHNWKILRVWHTDITYPNFYYQAGNGNVSSEGTLDTYCWSLDPSPFYYNVNWRTDEFIVKANTTYSTSDGVFTYKLNNQKIASCADDGYYFGLRNASGSVQDMRWAFLVHGVMANAPGFPGVNEHEWYDDIYFDNTWSRVMLGDSSTYTNSSYLEIQIPSAWSDGSITLTANQGVFTNGQQVYLYVVDSNGNANANGYPVIMGGGTADTTPPVISNGSPTGTLPAGTTQTTMSVITNESASCRYSTTAGTAYSSMTGRFLTPPGNNHSTSLIGLTDGQTYNFYIRCQDTAGNANTSDYTVNFLVASSADTTAPAAPTGVSVS